MNVVQLAHRLSKDDIVISGNSSQTGWKLQYGYSHLRLPDAAASVLFKTDIYNPEPIEGVSITVYYRVEGSTDKKERSHPLDLSDSDWFQRLNDLADEVFSHGRTIMCGKGIGLDQLQKDYPRGVSFCDTHLDRIFHFLFPEGEPDVNLDPDYQRAHVWTEKQASEFVGFLLQTGSGSSHAPLIFINRPRGGADMLPDEVIDGKQRLLAMFEWVTGNIPAIINGVEYWYDDTNEIERRGFPTFKVGYVNLNREQILRFYLALNRGGTVHSDKEIDKVTLLLDKETSNA